MENINCSVSGLNSADEVDYFEEDLVFSALNLVANFPVPPQKSLAAQNKEALAFDQETRRIDDMIRKLGDIVIDEKDEEISDLKCQLENKNTQTQQLEEKLAKLVEFITFMHGRFGDLMNSMLSMTRSGDNESFLYFGPFNKARTKLEFIQILKDLSTQLSNDYEDLVGTRELMEKANSILKRMEKTNQNKNSRKIRAPLARNGSLRNGQHRQSNALVSQDFNGGIHSASVPLQVTQPLNLTMGSPLSPYPEIRRPPPSISRNSVQSDLGRNLASVNKKHGVDHSKRHWGHFCLCQGTKFSSKASLLVHIKNFTVYKKFECFICKRRYMFPSMLRAHLISSHKIKSLVGSIVTCSNCLGKYGNYEEFCTHLQTCHYAEERVSSSKHKSAKNGSRCQYSSHGIPPTTTLERGDTLTLHYASTNS